MFRLEALEDGLWPDSLLEFHFARSSTGCHLAQFGNIPTKLSKRLDPISVADAGLSTRHDPVWCECSVFRTSKSQAPKATVRGSACPAIRRTNALQAHSGLNIPDHKSLL